jgi:hypothetical protein
MMTFYSVVKKLEVQLTLSEQSEPDINGQELLEELTMCTRTVPPNTDICNSLKHIRLHR